MAWLDHSHPARPLSQDRKSTRLNSSHSQISYAVFCLKKKTDTISHSADMVWRPYDRCVTEYYGDAAADPSCALGVDIVLTAAARGAAGALQVPPSSSH